MSDVDRTSGTSAQKPPEVMKKVDLQQDSLSPNDREYMARLSRAQMEKVHRGSRSKYLGRNIFVALCLGAAVAGVYTYTMYSVSQEAFLEDFDDPNKPKN